MSVQAEPRKAAGGPCGCGGDCGGGCGCGCKSADCSSCTDEGFVRPRFSAGQVLTDEDLELLGRYVTSKDRLHNSHLIGDGVVCGLEVTCHPCGGGRVVVRPGYALDCCGNDVVVPCPQELDVNALVRDLRVEARGGYDCGDPCAPAEPETPGYEHEREHEHENAGSSDTRHYSLFVRYCEELTDPIAPYATDEPCGGQTCEPTRVREAFRFELRCREERGEPRDLVARIWGCLDDVLALERDLDQDRTGRIMAPAQAAVAEYRSGTPPVAAPSDADAMTENVSRMEAWLEETSEGGGDTTEPRVRSVLEDFRRASAAAVRIRSTDPAHLHRIQEERGSLDDDLAHGAEVLRTVKERVEPLLESTLADRVERRSAASLLSLGTRWAAPDATAEKRSSMANYLAMHGAGFDDELAAVFGRSAAQVKEWLLVRLERATWMTACDLRDEVAAIDVSPPEGDPAQKIEASAIANRKLTAALVRYVAACVCAALNPPCPECDDPSVLLAGIEVRECDVVHVCNLERTIAPTPRAFSYWLPVERLGRVLDQACCELPRHLARRIGEGPRKRKEPAGLPREERVPEPVFEGRADATAAPFEGLLVRAGVPRTTARTVARVAGDVRAVSHARGIDLGSISLPRSGAIDVVAGGGPDVEEIARSEPFRSLIREEVAKTAGAAPPPEEPERLRRLEERLGELTGVKRDVTNLKKKTADLTKRNAELQRANAELRKRLDEAGGGR